MKILVGYKRVVDYNVRIQVKPDGTGVVTDGVKLSANPFDDIALEEALRLREKGVVEEVVIVGIGPADLTAHLRNGLAMGANRAIHIVTSDAWPDAAGVAVQLERRGASVEVDSDWVFLFGDAFRPRRLPTVELWFARAHELPGVATAPGAVELGTAGGVDIVARADLQPFIP